MEIGCKVRSISGFGGLDSSKGVIILEVLVYFFGGGSIGRIWIYKYE